MNARKVVLWKENPPIPIFCRFVAIEHWPSLLGNYFFPSLQLRSIVGIRTSRLSTRARSFKVALCLETGEWTYLCRSFLAVAIEHIVLECCDRTVKLISLLPTWTFSTDDWYFDLFDRFLRAMVESAACLNVFLARRLDLFSLFLATWFGISWKPTQLSSVSMLQSKINFLCRCCSRLRWRRLRYRIEFSCY